jgi:PAP2 superfamily
VLLGGAPGYGVRMSAPLDRGRLRVRSVARAGRACAAAAVGWSNLIARVRARALARDAGGRPCALAEVIGLLLWVLLFARLQSAAGKDVTAATANALALQSMERAMHIDIELSANHWLAGRLVLSHLAVYLYRLYYAVIVGVLVWVFIRHAPAYRKVRRVLVAMMALILPVYWAVPESPPRFALPGVIDIVAKYDILGHASRDTGNGQNHYSAMPSLHVGLSLWCAYAVWSVLRVEHPRLALLPWMFPLLMAADVLATGNHYVLDVAGSIVLLAVSIAAASMWGRLAEHRRQARPPRSVHT